MADPDLGSHPYRGGRVDHPGFFRRLASAARGDTEPVRGMVLDLAGDPAGRLSTPFVVRLRPGDLLT